MKAIHFKLLGKTAFFKKPDVNSFAYFTYNNIHKVALLGMLGAILGLKGYSHQKEDERYPEFYEKLRNLKVAILPRSAGGKGYFPKKIHEFNNSVGYASREEGGNLIVREQWLENPCWSVYLLDDGSDEFRQIKKYLLERKCEYIPYLGKNDHMADIGEVRKVDLMPNTSKYIDSLFPSKDVEWGNNIKDDELFVFKEMAPVGLNDALNFYEYTEMSMTSVEIKNIDTLPDVFSAEGYTLAFI